MTRHHITCLRPFPNIGLFGLASGLRLGTAIALGDGMYTLHTKNQNKVTHVTGLSMADLGGNAAQYLYRLALNHFRGTASTAYRASITDSTGLVIASVHFLDTWRETRIIAKDRLTNEIY